MEPRDPRLPRPDERARERAARPLDVAELRSVQGGIDTVPLPEMPAFWLGPKARAWHFLKP